MDENDPLYRALCGPPRPRPTHVLFVTEAEWLRIMEKVGGLPKAGEFGRDLTGQLLVAIKGELHIEVPECVFAVQVVESPPDPRFHVLG